MTKKQSNKNEVMPARYVDVKAVSGYTSLAESTLYEWAGQGKIPSIKAGGRRLFDLVDIDRYMASLKRTNNQEEKIVDKIVGGVNGNDI